jgi:hypothetical protein
MNTTINTTMNTTINTTINTNINVATTGTTTYNSALTHNVGIWNSLNGMNQNHFVHKALSLQLNLNLNTKKEKEADQTQTQSLFHIYNSINQRYPKRKRTRARDDGYDDTGDEFQFVNDYYYYTQFERQLMGLQQPTIVTSYTNNCDKEHTHNNKNSSDSKSGINSHPLSSSSSSSFIIKQHILCICNYIFIPTITVFTIITLSTIFSNILQKLLLLLLQCVTRIGLPTLPVSRKYILSNLYSIHMIMPTLLPKVMNTFLLLRLRIMDWKSLPLILTNYLPGVLQWNISMNASQIKGQNINNNENDENTSHISSQSNHDHPQVLIIHDIMLSIFTLQNNTLYTLLYTSIHQSIITPVQSFILNNQIMSRTKNMITKMIYMELWRQFWKQTFHVLRKDIYSFFVVTFFPSSSMSSLKSYNDYHSSIWEKNAPEFLRRGLKSIFVKYLQGHLESFIGHWFMKGYDLIGIYYVYNDGEFIEEDKEGVVFEEDEDIVIDATLLVENDDDGGDVK